jgi:hypothetical protein
MNEGTHMKAITVEPHKPESVRLEDIPAPDVHDGSVLVEAVAVGVCGTDVEIIEGNYGWAPPGRARLVLGHESLGRVLDPGPTGGLQEGDLVVGIVRRPDPVPCPNCAVGEWDMCRNGQYTERGIKQIDGFMSERWRIEPEYTMKVDRSLGLLGVLLEPTTVVTKAWEQVQAVGQRAFWEPSNVLVTGAGLSACWRRWSVGSTAWTCTCWTAPCRAPSPSSFAPWGRRTTPGALRMSASTPTSSSSAPASAKSSPTASTWPRAAESSASRASAAEAARRASPLMWPPPWSSRITSSLVA